MNEENKFPPEAVIIDVRPTDFIAGGETGIAATPQLVTDSQFDIYLPDEETQQNYHFDTFSCVSFSALNCIEIALNLKISKGMISKEKIQWLKDNGYIDYRTGKVNFSDRFTSKMSGTTQQGNSLGAVGDSARNHGLVPESAWPWPKEMTEATPYTERWNLYYAEIPQSVKDLGLKFREMFEISYQWVILGNSADAERLIKLYLPYGPLQIASAVCSPWNSNEAMPPIEGCGCGTGHATLIYGYNDKVSYKDFDHYKSFRKLLAWNYCIPYAVQYYISEKTVSKPVPPTVNLVLGDVASPSVRALQSVLQFLKDKTGAPYMRIGLFGPFGPQTQISLAKFQLDNGIADTPQGSHYGPNTRKAMIAALLK